MSEHEVELPNINELHEHRENNFSRIIAMVTAIFAVILAITSLGGNDAMKETLLDQQQASDQWAHYQAKSVRESIYQSELVVLKAFAPSISSGKSSVAYDKLINTMNKSVSKYDNDKKEIAKEAKNLEHERDIYRHKNVFFEYAAALLQIAIVLSSISILARSKSLFSFAVVLAIIGVILSLNGFFLFL